MAAGTPQSENSAVSASADEGHVRQHRLVCRAGAQLCAVPLDRVVEVMRALPIKPVSGGAALRVRLVHHPRRAGAGRRYAVLLIGDRPTACERLITVRTGSRTVALAAEAVLGICAIGAEKLEPAAAASARRRGRDDCRDRHARCRAALLSAHRPHRARGPVRSSRRRWGPIVNCQATRLDLERFRTAIAQQDRPAVRRCQARLPGEVLQRRLDKLGRSSDAYLWGLQREPASGEIDGARARADRRRDLLLPQHRAVPRARRGRAARAHARRQGAQDAAPAVGRLRLGRRGLLDGHRGAGDRRGSVLGGRDPGGRPQPGGLGEGRTGALLVLGAARDAARRAAQMVPPRRPRLGSRRDRCAPP